MLKSLLVVLLVAFSPIPNASAAWAIALGDDRPVVAVDYPDWTAMEMALSGCKKISNGCRIVAKSGSGCFALATTGTRWGVGKAGSRARAKERALEACTALGAGDCEVVHTKCVN